MKIVRTRQFEKDMKALTGNAKLTRAIEHIIQECESANSLHEIEGVKSLTNNPGYYRIRYGNYRIGVFQDSETLILMRVLSRKDIYRYFP